MPCNRAHCLEWSLREQSANTTWVFSFPRAQLDEIRGGENELDFLLRRRGPAPIASLASSREYDPSLGERLKRGRNICDNQYASCFCDAVKQLHAGLRQATWVTQLGKRHEGSCDLRW